MMLQRRTDLRRVRFIPVLSRSKPGILGGCLSLPGRVVQAVLVAYAIIACLPTSCPVLKNATEHVTPLFMRILPELPVSRGT